MRFPDVSVHVFYLSPSMTSTCLLAICLSVGLAAAKGNGETIVRKEIRQVVQLDAGASMMHTLLAAPKKPKLPTIPEGEVQEVLAGVSEHQSACSDSGRAVPTKTFDVVITWTTGSNQSNFRKSFLEFSHNHTHTAKTHIENQNEITYLLRGIDQFGMLPYVNRIFIVINRDIIHTYGAPRNVNWKHPKVQLIHAQDLGCAPGVDWFCKAASFHRIPGISEWFLHLQDDIFLAKPFSMNLLFDGVKPRFWKNKDLYGSKPADCPAKGMPQLETGHMPWLVNKCFMEEIEREYSSYFNSVRNHNSTNQFSAMCLYDSLMNGQARTSITLDQSNHYGVVCHLGTKNSQCPPGTNSQGSYALGAVTSILNDPPVFLNLQGLGVSDDYAKDGDDNAVHAKVLQWFRTFYKPSALTLNVDGL